MLATLPAIPSTTIFESDALFVRMTGPEELSISVRAMVAGPPRWLLVYRGPATGDEPRALLAQFDGLTRAMKRALSSPPPITDEEPEPWWQRW